MGRILKKISGKTSIVSWSYKKDENSCKIPFTSELKRVMFNVWEGTQKKGNENEK